MSLRKEFTYADYVRSKRILDYLLSISLVQTIIFATPLCDEYKNTLKLNGKGAFLRNVEPP